MNDSEWVLINGVKWATRNVDWSGTFVSNPENYGNYYTWEQAKIACPTGWRLPTETEMESLLNTTCVTNERATRNGVNGRIFVDKVSGNSVFFPAAGTHLSPDGKFYLEGSSGYYWSSSVGNREHHYVGNGAIGLRFVDSSVFILNSDGAHKFSIRCVSQ